MFKCPTCGNELPADAANCGRCGQLVDPVAEGASRELDGDDELDFIVTEAREDSRELVGGISPEPGDRGLEISSSASLMAEEAILSGQNGDDSQLSGPGRNSALGGSKIYASSLPDRENLSEGDSTNSRTSPADPEPSPDGVERLSAEVITAVEQNLYHESESAADESTPVHQPNDYVGHSDSFRQDHSKPTGFDNAPIVPPKRTGGPASSFSPEETGPPPKMAQRVRGIAFFWRNFIQIKGETELHEHDEVAVNERVYSLRKKGIGLKLMVGLLTPLAIVLAVIIGPYLAKSANDGQGQIVGMALDGDRHPFVRGALIKLRETGRSYETNGQGFFKTDLLNPGTYRIDYVVNGEVACTDYATVVRDKITTVALIPESAVNSGKIAENSVHPGQPLTSEPARQSKTVAQITAKTPEQNTAARSTARKSQAETTNTAKLRLATNVESARLSIDGSVIGAGNLTFSRLTPGSHKYSVGADGYCEASGTIELSAEKTAVLEITLEPLSAAEKAASLTDQDYLAVANNALLTGDYQTAIPNLTAALKIRPENANTVFLRAETYEQLQNHQAAHDDYVRAAEQYRFKKQINEAITSYNHAIELIPGSIPALLGRAAAYLVKGEEIPAIADYESVIKIDRRNTQAYYGLGQARFEQDYYKKAIKHFKDARSLEPEDPKIYQYLMLSYLAADDVKQVRKTFEHFGKVASREEVERLFRDERFAAVIEALDDKE